MLLNLTSQVIITTHHKNFFSVNVEFKIGCKQINFITRNIDYYLTFFIAEIIDSLKNIVVRGDNYENE